MLVGWFVMLSAARGRKRRRLRGRGREGERWLREKNSRSGGCRESGERVRAPESRTNLLYSDKHTASLSETVKPAAHAGPEVSVLPPTAITPLSSFPPSSDKHLHRHLHTTFGLFLLFLQSSDPFSYSQLKPVNFYPKTTFTADLKSIQDFNLLH